MSPTAPRERVRWGQAILAVFGGTIVTGFSSALVLLALDAANLVPFDFQRARGLRRSASRRPGRGRCWRRS